MADSTVATAWGLLRVEVLQRGEHWTARLIDPPSAYAATPVAVGVDRDGVLSSLQAVVRAVDCAVVAPARIGPASSDLCP